jgi:uncharacterized protein
MSDERGEILLHIARAAISSALGVLQTADESAPWLRDPGACFVTLTRNGELRGCIGSLAPHRSLLDDVKSNAVFAALHDQRFMPMEAAELDSTSIEISLLTPAQPLAVRDETDALSQLRPGIDGVVFEFDGFRSTFLPQVWEHFPQPRVFLAMLKRKAGLPDDFWADGVKISRYSVTIYKEKEPWTNPSA